MLEIYPVTQTASSSAAYAVSINGTSVPLNFMRVSKEPFNRRWPGHQRQPEQTEEAAFVSLASNEPLVIEVSSTIGEDLSQAVIRPLSLGITPVLQNGTARFTIPGSAYFTFEPSGRHNALHFFIDPPADYDVTPNAPSVLYYGPGIHEAGLIELKSGQTLFIDAGAVVFACVHAIDSDNIRILGRGILDNSHNRETIRFKANAENNNAAVNNAYRRHTVELEYCTNIVIDGINEKSYRQNGLVQKVFVPIQEPLRAELIAFYESVVNGAPIAVDGGIGVRAIEICEEVVRQAKQ